ncbi:hypothetical protein TSUD_224330 [Trifolium subterraneum]|uniref:AAA-type ATPase N-terminal domain-containing protein n=1 Tax=Trifolium subterraneum TaxID=3900 RepID=A0A2Z6MLX4_TRISU|nr:hypothetical protein TSUD_224330 [Trifolium subterraneum]
MRTPMFGRYANIGSTSSWFELYASFSTFMMLLRTAINDLIPLQLRTFIIIKLKSFFTKHQPNNQVSLQIDQFWDGSINNLYYAAKEYLPTKISNTYKSLKVGKLPKHNNLVLAFDGKQTVMDEFENIEIDELLEKVEATPAVVAEYLLRNEDPNVALKEIVKFLKELDIPKVVMDEECSQKV